MALLLPDGSPLVLDRPWIMGILNVTPDSFSDGGRHAEPDAAVAHALRMADEGADIIDLGGESTRPGSERVGADEQIARVLPVLEKLMPRLRERAGGCGLSGAGGVVVSIDTTLAAVAAAALDAGAAVINDISAGRDDPAMLPLAASRGTPVVLMHMQGTPRTMQEKPAYADVAGEVRDFLLARAAAAVDAGVPGTQIILDPGIGFGKTREHNLRLLSQLPGLAAAGYPVLLGASRKRFMGSIGARPVPKDADPALLLGATCATTALGVAAGVKIFRVHDVRANRLAADVAWAIARSK